MAFTERVTVPTIVAGIRRATGCSRLPLWLWFVAGVALLLGRMLQKLVESIEHIRYDVRIIREKLDSTADKRDQVETEMAVVREVQDSKGRDR